MCLCKSTISISIIFLPYTIRKLGIVLGTIINALVLVLNVFSLKFIGDVGYELNTTEMNKICEKTSNSIIRHIIYAIHLSMHLIILIFYYELTFDWILQIAVYFINGYYNMQIQIGFIIFLYTFMLLFPNIDKLKHVDTTYILCLSLVSFVFIGKFMFNYKEISVRPLNYFNASLDSLQSIEIILFTYCNQLNILPALKGIDSEKERTIVIIISSCLTFLVYAITSILIYLSNTTVESECFRYSTPLFLFNFFRMGIGALNILVFLQVGVSAQDTLHFLLKPVLKHFDNRSIRSMVIVVAVYLIFMMYKSSVYLSSLVFFVLISFVMFLIPSYFYWKVMVHKRTVYFKVLLCIYGVVSGGCIVLGVLVPWKIYEVG